MPICAHPPGLPGGITGYQRVRQNSADNYSAYTYKSIWANFISASNGGDGANSDPFSYYGLAVLILPGYSAS
ncbi:hypothetical protein [Agriterribacter sp.]|uniref:hypothetical protein n=1 Tax=Agriterribacter sp. TaxID=2821509 RepID=UPI002C03089D|nr:hypothetical protein [Agriterribacter sp.]HRO44585.1 hypothetical protein [Agriterribacter sp.]HRQ16022.1 hypothetical protein [Agriterribacter sp.]